MRQNDEHNEREMNEVAMREQERDESRLDVC